MEMESYLWEVSINSVTVWENSYKSFEQYKVWKISFIHYEEDAY